MALWKVIVKKGGNVNGMKLEAGMSVEVSTKSTSDPIKYGDGMDAIADAFSSKYGFDCRKFRSINMQYQLESKNLSLQMSLNQQLSELYASKFEGLNRIFSELQEQQIDDYSWPLLLHVWEEEYNNAPIKLMVIGQETNGWNAPIDTCDDIEKSMESYKKFNLGKDYPNSNFWPWVYEINRLLGNSDTNCFVWNNILKFGKECDKGRPVQDVTDRENNYFNVIANEINILTPDVCLFLTGPYYDNDIKAKFDDAEFIEFDDYPIRVVAQIKSKYLPEHSYRTYHPGYGNRYSEWYHKVFESIVERINSNK